jgi:2',3'-cyclic-nucleotide 2'-phosphodiesterase (5'-nucleotidase family)
MRKLASLFFLYSVIVLSVSCKTVFQPVTVQYKDYRVSNKQPLNNELTKLLQPYADSVNKSMNDVIAIAGITLEKKQPEGTLNNVLADAMLAMAREKYQTNVDASFLNYGGIRLPSIQAGNITRGKIFEISPFDNYLVVLKVDANAMQQFLNIIAKKGGWPCAGISFQIKNKEAVNIVINGKTFDNTAVYIIATIDYIANGGEDCDMLKNLIQLNKGYLFRDAIIGYFSNLQLQGKSISSSIQNRVSNAE